MPNADTLGSVAKEGKDPVSEGRGYLQVLQSFDQDMWLYSIESAAQVCKENVNKVTLSVNVLENCM